MSSPILQWTENPTALILFGTLVGVLVFILVISISIWALYRRRTQHQSSARNLTWSNIRSPQRGRSTDARMWIRFYLRGSVLFTLENEQLPMIGSRSMRKYHVLVKLMRHSNLDASKARFGLLSLTMYRQGDRNGSGNHDKRLLDMFTGVCDTDEQIKALLIGCMQECRLHPHIMPFLDFRLDSIEQFWIAVHPFDGKSVKDLIYRVGAPLLSYESKYEHNGHQRKEGYPLTDSQIAIFGRHILEALKFIRFHGIPYLHLSSGNVIVSDVDQQARLLGIDTSLFGCTFPFQTEIVSALMKTIEFTSFEDLWLVHERLIVLQFGHVLFEMATGHTVSTCSKEESRFWPAFVPSQLNPVVFDCLEMIFGRLRVQRQDVITTTLFSAPVAQDYGHEIDKPLLNHCFPSLENLLHHPLFSQVKIQSRDDSMAGRLDRPLFESSPNMAKLLENSLRTCLMLRRNEL